MLQKHHLSSQLSRIADNHEPPKEAFELVITGTSISLRRCLAQSHVDRQTHTERRLVVNPFFRYKLTIVGLELVPFTLVGKADNEFQVGEILDSKPKSLQLARCRSLRSRNSSLLCQNGKHLTR